MSLTKPLSTRSTNILLAVLGLLLALELVLTGLSFNTYSTKTGSIATTITITSTTDSNDILSVASDTLGISKKVLSLLISIVLFLTVALYTYLYTGSLVLSAVLSLPVLLGLKFFGFW